MLCELHIRDLGIIEDARITCRDGLNVVTGETGAGKTLLVTSLVLLGGGRGSARLVRHGAAEASIEAVLRPTDRTRALLTERGLDVSDELVVSRRISADGRSRAWVSGTLVPISVLGEVCSTIVEVHGQDATFTLAAPERQLAALDAFAGTEPLRERYAAALDALRALEAEHEALAVSDRERARQADFLRFQIDEISQAELSPGEDKQLASEIGRLTHAEKLTEVGERVAHLLGSEGACGILSEASGTLEEAAALDPSLRTLADRVAGLSSEASEAARDVRSWGEGIDPDPRRLERLRERSAQLSTLERKYGDTAEDVLEACEAARRMLADLEGADARLASLGEDVTTARSQVEEAASALSEARHSSAGELAALVRAELPALALPGASFEVACEDTGELRASGRDRVRFLLSANPDTPPDRIDAVASGGELARTMIAVSLALARSADVGVLVFDEADRGVGGQAALEVAKRLARLGTSRQVLVVTHLPQVAAFAHHHVRVRKTAGDVSVDPLDDAGRLEELSRMLAGLESSTTAKAHAAELLSLAAKGP